MTPSPRSRSFSKLFKLKEEVDKLLKSGVTVPFIAVTESWLKDHIHDTQIGINDYNVFRSDRKVSKNGGVALYLHRTIVVTEISYFDDDNCEGVICFCKNVKYIIACIYRPPHLNEVSFSNLLQFMMDFINSHNPLNKYQIIIFGDFNFPNICWNTLSFSSDAISLNNFMDKLFLDQYICENTRKSNILDLLLTDDCNFVQLVKAIDVNFSDHKLVKIFTDSFSSLNQTPNTATNLIHCGDLHFSKINLNSSDFESINSEFSKIDWVDLVNVPIEDFPDIFHQKVYKVILKYSKLNKPRYKGYSNYCSRDLKAINRKLRKYKKRALELSVTNPHKINQNKKQISALEKLKENTILKVRLIEEQKAIEKIKSNNKYFFRYANKFKKSASSPNILMDATENPVVDQKQISDLLQDQFRSVFSVPKNNLDYYPLTNNISIRFPLPDLIITDHDIILAIDKIKADSKYPNYAIPGIVFKKCKYTLCKPLKLFWQKSFNKGHVPKKYKKQLIIPIWKNKGLKTAPETWRPICFIPDEIKIVERIFRSKIASYFEENLFFNPNQHGFRSQRSCSTQLQSHIHTILTNLSKGDDTDCIYVDYAKAFDKVDHGLLLHKLELYGLPVKYLAWIRSFLCDRVQTVSVNGSLSYPAPVLSGVPQGSVLAPLFFIISINDLPNVIQNSSVFTFADDTKLVSKISNSQDSLNLQNDLNNLISWTDKNNMLCNEKKFVVLCHTFQKETKNQALFNELPFNNPLNYQLSNSTQIESSPYVKDLGVFVDVNLNWNVHIQNISSKARQVCAWILSVFYTRDKCTMLTLFNSLVRPKLEYSSEIWNPFLRKDILRVEGIQRTFTSKINGMHNFDYWERLTYLNILSLQRRRERNIIINVFKIKNQLIPNTFNLTFKEARRSTAMKAELKPMPKLRGKTLTLYEESFLIKSAKLWNILPGDLTNLQSLTLFKTKLGQFLSKVPDHPPFPGYPFTTDNSLTQQCLGLK